MGVDEKMPKIPSKPMIKSKDILKPLGQSLSLGEAVMRFPIEFGRALSGKNKWEKRK